MVRWNFPVIMIGLGLLATSCGGSDGSGPTGVVNSPRTASAGPGQIDGNYNGVMQLVSGPDMSCGSDDNFMLNVRNSAFRYMLRQPRVPWRPTVTFNVSIAPDGSFHAVSGTAYIDGKISQGHMQGKIVGDSCGFWFTADSNGTF
jgi:hypothetical protein